MTQENKNMSPDNTPEVVFSFGRTEIPYDVPSGYFDELADNILVQVHLSNYSRENVSKVPDNYFDYFADSVLQKIKEEEADEENDVLHELKEIAPLLTNISRQNVYTAPAGYFENFEVKKSKRTRVVALEEKSKKSTWRGVAVAAALLIAVLTIGFIFDRNDVLQVEKSEMYASVQGKEVDSLKPAAENVSGYLSTPGVENDLKGVKIVTPQDINVINVSHEINTISSRDLEEYLNNTPAIN